MLSIDFEPLYRSSIGFEPIFSLLESTLDSASGWDSYPPYNIEHWGEDRYRLTLNVAGFRQDEMAVEAQQNWLLVRGHKSEKAPPGGYLYEGFTPRDFERRFQLADYVTVEGATLADGLLTVELRRELPEAMKPRRVEIGAPKLGIVQKAKKLLDQAA